MTAFAGSAPALAESTVDPLAAVASAAGPEPSTSPVDADLVPNPMVLCGPGYLIVSSDGVHRYDTERLIGTVYLMYNPVLGRYCGTTVKYAYTTVVTRTSTFVWSVEPMRFVTDDGPRLGYAGPVDVVGTDCAVYGGAVSDPDGNVFLDDSANAAIGGKSYCPSTRPVPDSGPAPL